MPLSSLPHSLVLSCLCPSLATREALEVFHLAVATLTAIFEIALVLVIIVVLHLNEAEHLAITDTTCLTFFVFSMFIIDRSLETVSLFVIKNAMTVSLVIYELPYQRTLIFELQLSFAYSLVKLPLSIIRISIIVIYHSFPMPHTILYLTLVVVSIGIEHFDPTCPNLSR